VATYQISKQSLQFEINLNFWTPQQQ